MGYERTPRPEQDLLGLPALGTGAAFPDIKVMLLHRARFPRGVKQSRTDDSRVNND